MHKPAILPAAAHRFYESSARGDGYFTALQKVLARLFRLNVHALLLTILVMVSGIAPAFADSFYYTRTRSGSPDAQTGATGLFIWNDATNAQSQVGGNGINLRHATDGAMSVDGIASNGSGTLYGFALDDTSNAGFLPFDSPNYCTASVRSRLVSINTTTGVLTYIGNWMSGRHISGAAFDGQGRLWAIDCRAGAVVQINPATGAVVRSISVGAMSFASDLDFAANGTGIIGWSGLLFRTFDPNSGWVSDVSIQSQNSGFDGALAPPYAIAGVGFTTNLSARNGSPAANSCRLNIAEGRGTDELGHANDPFFADPVIAFKEADQYNPANVPLPGYNTGPEDMARVGGPALPNCFFDWGDAPASYGTLKANNGAYHAIVATGPYLGAGQPDFEVDGQPNAAATGDNGAGTDDEDGVSIPVLAPGGQAQITVTAGNVSADTRLQAWIDWAGDGSFAEAGDQILTDATVTAGANTFTVNVPAGAVSGTAMARFRIANESGLGAVGPAASGEVEDYEIEMPDQPNFGSCDARMFLAQNQPTALYQFDTSSNPIAVQPVGPTSSFNYNAVAYNPLDNYLYALSSNNLLRIGGDGSVTNLGAVTNLPAQAYNSGEIAPDGSFYVRTQNSSQLYRIDLNTKTAVGVALTETLSTADLAWHNGLLYTVDNQNFTNTLYAINPTSGQVTLVGPTGLTSALFGALFGASNGLYGGNNSGGFYQFDIATGTATLISDLQGSGNNDGAKCATSPMLFPADLSITKDDGTDTFIPGEDVSYNIVVSNLGPFGVAGALVNDPLPAGITTASWTCGGATNGAVCTVPSGTGAISNVPVNLPVGGSVTFALTMSVPADFEGDLVNTATVTSSPGSSDPNLDNNTDTDTDTPEDAAATVAKVLVGESITDNDIAEPGETLTYDVTVTHTAGPAFADFDFIENIPDGATMVSVTGADGFTDPVAGPATVQLTVPTVPVGGTSVVTIELLVDAPIPLGITNITNRISGGDVPADCTECSVSTPTPTYVPVRPPTIACTTTGNYFNTAYNAANGGMLTTGTEPIWEVALTQTPVTGAPPASLAWGNATVVSSPPAVYMTSPFSNANWISHNAAATHPAAGNYDIFYRYQFNLAPGVDPSSLDLDMTLYSDNAVYQVWVNGVAQGIQSNYGAADPYFYVGFNAAGGASGSMNGSWQAGLNTIVVHVKSGPGAQAFMAQVETPALCRPKLTLRKEVANDNGGTALVGAFTLRASGPAVIEGTMSEPAVTNASIPAGTYTLSEDPVAGYTAAPYSCAVDGGAAVSGDTLTLANGQNAICTVVNDDESATLTLQKSVVNDAGGTAAATDFVLRATGPSTISGATGSASVTNAPVSAGVYTLSEDNLPGYAAGAYSCSVNGGAAVSGNSLTLANGDAAVCTIVNDDESATLTLQKTVVNNDGGIATPDDFTLQGTGPATISGITGAANVTAAAVPAGTYTLAEIGPAGYTAGTYRCSINGGAVVTGNSVTLAGGQAAVCTITNDDIAPSVTMAKALVGESGTQALMPEPGETLTYAITLTNTGGTASGYDLVDVLDTNVTFVSADNGGVLVGSEVQWTDLVVPAADGATPGTLVLTIVVTVNDPLPPTATEIVNMIKEPGGPDPECPSDQCVVIPPPPYIEMVKSLTGETGAVPGVAEAGEQLTYTITLTNTGSGALGYAVRDRLAANTTFVSADNGGTHAAGVVDWTGLTVPGASGGVPGTLALTVTVTVDDPIPPGTTQFTNIAFDPTEPEPTCPSDQCATVPAEGNVAIGKALVGESGTVAGVAEAGETLSYQITLTNTGGAVAGYAVQDVLDADVTFASADNGGVHTGGVVNWTGLTVPAHDGTNPGLLVLSVEVTVNDPLPASGAPITNIAKVPGDPDPICPSNQCVTVPREADISIVKQLVSESGSVPDVAEAGETLTYEITLTNNGGITTDYALEDRPDANTVFVTASHGGQLVGDRIAWSNLTVPAHAGTSPGTLVLAVTVTVEDPLPSGVASIANIAKEPGTPDPACPSDQCVVIVTEPSVAISKALVLESGAQANVAEPGEVLTYEITLTNTGGAASAYAVQDVLDPNTTFVSANNGGVDNGTTVDWTGLAVPAFDGTNPGELVLRVEVVVDDPLPAGVSQLSNIAKEPGMPDPLCPSDQCVVTPAAGEVAKTKALTVESGMLSGVAEPGEVLTYEITLTNTGGVASGYAVQDVLDPNTSVVSVSHGGRDNGTSIDWINLTVPAHDGTNPGQLVLTVEVQVDDPLADGVTQLVNLVKEPGDPDPVCPSAQCVVTPAVGKVAISKALVGETGATPGAAEPGETLTYAITLTNNGGEATGYAVQDVLDPNTSFVSASHGGINSGAVVDWTGLTVPAHSGAAPGTLVLTVEVTVANPLPSGVTHLSNIAKEPGTPDPACPSAQCVQTPVASSVTPVKRLVSESGPHAGIAEAGETLTYEITLTNAGGVANGYAIQDVLDANTTFASADNGAVHTAGVVDWAGLTVPGHDGTNPGTLVLRVEVTVNRPLPEGVTQVSNIVKVPGAPDPACPSDQCVTVPAQAPALTVLKDGAFEDTDGNDISSPGDTIVYTFTVTNTGNIALADVVPVDAGPSFNGAAGGNTLSAFDPSSRTLAPGESGEFTARYVLTQADIDNAAGIPDAVENTATAVGYVNGTRTTGSPVESQGSTVVVALPAAASEVSIAKVALLRYLRRGEEAPFAITVSNLTATPATDLTIIDTLPSGFRFVEGSATVGGVAATPIVEGSRVIFENVTVPGNSQIEIRLRMLALSSAGPGDHVNRASVTDARGNPLAPDATATVEILAEPVFDCGDIIGKVFDDKNRNGYQDEGEPGLPGVRITTVDGWLITTDAHGRFHVPCAALPDQRTGSNFIMKLDTRTLPTGYRLTTENPRVVRLTAGKMTELNFGASIGRVVRLNLQDAAFEPGRLEVRPEWVLGIDQLIAVLTEEQSVLRLTYIDAAADPEFAEERLKHLRDLISERWRQTSGQYRLEIEMRVETGQ